MKTILIILFTVFTMNLDAQKLQVTGLTNIDSQWNQMVKTIDSLNIVIVNNRKDFVSWQNSANARIRVKSDSIRLLKKTIDSLKIKQFVDSIEFIGFEDTITGTYTKITEKEYNVAPKFSWQVLKRYPIKIGTATKTKEVTITELVK